MDLLYKGLAFDNKISVTVIEATELVNEAIKIHKLSAALFSISSRRISALLPEVTADR